MPYDPDFPWDGERRHERDAINSPVTIVEGGRGGCGPSAPTINLEQYSDYILRKFERYEEQGQKSGQIPSWGPMAWAVKDQIALPALKVLGFTTEDAMFTLTAAMTCKIPDAGAGTLTMTIKYDDITLGITTVTFTRSLTAAATTTDGPTVIVLAAGGSVTVSITGGGTFGAATYDAFVQLAKVIS